MTYQQHKYILCTTSIQNFQPEITINIKRQQSKRHKTTGPHIKHQRNPLISEKQTSSLIDASDVVTHHMHKDSNVLQKNFSVKCVTNLDTSLQSVTRRNNRHHARLSLGNLRHTNFEQGPFTLIKMMTETYLKSQILMNHSVYRWKYRKHN